MRYFFESKVEKKDAGYTIQILSMYGKYVSREKSSKETLFWDNNIIECELHPKEKGNYEIVITDENAKVELGVAHKILLHVNGSLIRMDQKQPFTVSRSPSVRSTA